MNDSVSDRYDSAHDPLCFVNNLCVECHCELIAKVREDERKQLIADARSEA